MSPVRSVIWHLAPGVAVAAIYLALVPLAPTLELPTAAALGAAGVVGVGPVLLGLLWLARRSRAPAGERVVLFRVVPSARTVLGWAGLIVVLAAGVFVLTRPVAAWWESVAFGWWPPTWKPDLGTAGGYRSEALWWTAALLLVGSAGIAAVVEEVYFRGFLLPRMPAGLGRWTALVHTALFALYHVWTPWLAPTRTLAVLPLTLVAQRTRSVLPGIVAHVMVNLVDVVVLVAYLRGR